MKKVIIQLNLIMLVVFSFISCEDSLVTEEKLIAAPIIEEEEQLPEWVEKMENPLIDWVKVYPGEVAVKEPRIQSTFIKINSYYKKNTPSMANNGGNPLFSTGYYASPAEVITLVSPASLEGKTVGYVININPCNLDKPCTGGGAVGNQKRYSMIRKSGTFFMGVFC